MIIDNTLTMLGIPFMIYIFVKSKKTIKEIEQSRNNISNFFIQNKEELRLSTDKAMGEEYPQGDGVTLEDMTRLNIN